VEEVRTASNVGKGGRENLTESGQGYILDGLRTAAGADPTKEECTWLSTRPQTVATGRHSNYATRPPFALPRLHCLVHSQRPRTGSSGNFFRELVVRLPKRSHYTKYFLTMTSARREGK